MPRSSSSPLSPEWDLALLGYELSCSSRNLSDRTFANRRSTVLKMVAWLGVDDPAEVTKIQMMKWMKHVYSTHTGSGPRGEYNNAKAFWQWWAAENELPSPMAGIQRPKDVVPQVEVLTADEVERLLKVTSGKDRQSIRDRALLLILMESGLRRAEVAALNVEDIDIRAREVEVRNGKGGKPRTASFGTDTALALTRLLKVHQTKRGALFVRSNGVRLSEQSITLVVRRRADEAGVEDVHPHRFRHNYAHTWLSQGGSEVGLMTLCGWSSSQMLLRYGASGRRQRALAEAKSINVMSAVRAR